MDIYSKKSRWKLFLFAAALLIGVLSLIYTNIIANWVRQEEEKSIRIWTQANKELREAKGDLTLPLLVVEANTTVPVLLVDEAGRVLETLNYSKSLEEDPEYFKKELEDLKASTTPFTVTDPFIGTQYVYYKNSKILQLLNWFPYIQLLLALIFVGAGYWAFSSSRRSEQNLVWVGMAKETAHQLGTPISSLVAWIEHLKALEPDNENFEMVAEEMEKDMERLGLVADRFSKIGSKPKLEEANIFDIIIKNLDYIKRRASRKITFQYPEETHPIYVSVNHQLFDWVIENLLKNALDAMEGKGGISAEIKVLENDVFVDISDTGKGIPRSKFKSVFQPGFTTKKRGWGLGLSLTKRIVENYHGGKIFVKNSVLGEGTTFRIKMPLTRL